MDAITRNSRWNREPVIGKDGKPVVVRLTERDIEIFKLLARYRFLSFDYIHALIGGGKKGLKHRLNLLYRRPNAYIDRPQQQRENADANYRFLVYELDERGSEIIGKDKPKYSKIFRHELMTGQIAASLEIGAKANQAVTLIPWADIMASGKCIAYFGRTLKDESPPLIFPSGTNPAEHIFNAHNAQPGELYLVRDPLQVLSAFEAGIENVVSFLTETISAQQLEQLASLMDEKHCENVSLY